MNADQSKRERKHRLFLFDVGGDESPCCCLGTWPWNASRASERPTGWIEREFIGLRCLAGTYDVAVSRYSWKNRVWRS